MLPPGWLQHILGVDNASGRWYLFWSGFFFVLVLIIGQTVNAYVTARRHNCHEPWCWRVGKFPVEGTPWVKCRRHHPDDDPGKG